MFTDGDLAIDDDAAVSVSPGNGAYVTAWAWIGNDEFLETHQGGTLEIETSDGRMGTEVFVLYEGVVVGLGMRWDRDGDGETTQATFRTGNNALVTNEPLFVLSGDDWYRRWSVGKSEPRQ